MANVLCLLDSFNDTLVQPFMPNRSVVALDISVLLGFAGLDMSDADLAFFGAGQQLAAELFKALIQERTDRSPSSPVIRHERNYVCSQGSALNA